MCAKCAWGVQISNKVVTSWRIQLKGSMMFLDVWKDALSEELGPVFWMMLLLQKHSAACSAGFLLKMEREGEAGGEEGEEEKLDEGLCIYVYLCISLCMYVCIHTMYVCMFGYPWCSWQFTNSLFHKLQDPRYSSRKENCTFWWNIFF